MSSSFIKVLGGGVVSSHMEWGATCIFLTINGVNIVIDCGTRAWNRQNPLPNLSWLEGKRIDAIFFTHAHADHLGAGPVLAALHPEAKIYMTSESADLSRFQLFKQMRIEHSRGNEHIFNESEHDDFVERTWIVNFGNWITFGDSDREVSVCMWPSGHIRGAASILVKSSKQKIVFSGDISHFATPTVETAPRLPDEFADGNTILVTGATNGNARLPNREQEKARMVELVREVTQRKDNPGSVLFPAFSVGRAQDLALDFAEAGIESWLGGWGKQILESEAYGEQYFHRSIRTYDEVELLLRTKKPKVIIATPGMMDWGASKLAARKLVREAKNAICFTGYQAPGTFGKKLSETKCSCAIEFEEPIPESVTVNAKIERFSFSGHSDGQQLAQWITSFDPQRVFVVHAEMQAYIGLTGYLETHGYKGVIGAAQNNDKFPLS